LRTLNTLTGAIVFSFTYDSASRLIKITDGDGLVTMVEREGTGKPTAIVAPGGQRTTLTLNGNGYLTSASDPGGNTVQLGYTSEGLLTSLTDPRGQAHTMT